MKTRITTLSFLVCFIMVGAADALHAQQTITLTFTGKNASTGAAQKLDS